MAMFSPKISLFLLNFMKLVKKYDPEDKKWFSLVKKWAFDPKNTSEKEWDSREHILGSNPHFFT